jgi:hypothetical protein
MARTDIDSRSANQRARDASYIKAVLDLEAARIELGDAERFILLAAAVVIDRIRADSWRRDDALNPQFEALPFAGC